MSAGVPIPPDGGSSFGAAGAGAGAALGWGDLAIEFVEGDAVEEGRRLNDQTFSEPQSLPD